MTFSSVFNILLVAIAFGFVIFWHELGHFLAARWAGVRVEQFAVGMGHALTSWRRGIGFRFGNTQTEFDKRIDDEIARRGAGRLPSEYSLRERYDIAEEIGIGETEYRLSWIPLGGYVKPTGQDDLRPADDVRGDDPKSFGAKPVGKRMVIICAGVVMNVILAFALYVALFMYGFNAPPTVIGQVLPGSPAQAGGLRAGDKILTLNGKEQQDYTKLRMNVALLRTDESSEFVVDRPGVGRQSLSITPAKNTAEYGMAAIGVLPASTLVPATGLDAEDDLISPEMTALPKDSRIVRINGVDVAGDKTDSALVAAITAAGGRSVPVAVRHADGSEHAFDVRPTLMPRFNAVARDDGRSIAGLIPRVKIVALQRGAPAEKVGLKPGDVIEQIVVVGTNEAIRPPTFEQFLKTTGEAGEKGKKLRLTVVRDGKILDPIEIDPSHQIDKHHRGIGVKPDIDLGDPVIAGVAAGTAVASSATSQPGAAVAAGDRITAIDGTAVKSWPDVIAAFRAAGGKSVELSLTSEAGPKTVKLAFSADERAALASMTFAPMLPLAPLIETRHTTNPLTAAAWGYAETKWSLLQVYVTLRRLFEGQVPLSNLSGPVGIFTAGTSMANRGFDYLIWFAALISANLAVVNFLPIPIVDGGLFTFLVAEKITGKPPSPRVQTAAQIAGIVLLGSLFLFVTYHDILRQWG